MSLRIAVVGSGKNQRVLVAWGNRRMVDPKTGEVPKPHEYLGHRKPVVNKNEKHQMTSDEVDDLLMNADSRYLDEVNRQIQKYEHSHPWRARMLRLQLRWLEQQHRKEVLNSASSESEERPRRSS